MKKRSLAVKSKELRAGMKRNYVTFDKVMLNSDVICDLTLCQRQEWMICAIIKGYQHQNALHVPNGKIWRFDFFRKSISIA